MSFVRSDFVDGTPLPAANLNTNFTHLLDLMIVGEDATTLVTGSTSGPFATAFTFKPGTIAVFLAGARIRKDSGTTYFTETLDTDGNGMSISLNTVPSASTELLFDYQKSQDN